jgi:hypothetical protein
MTPEQIDAVDNDIASVLDQIGYCKLEVFLYGNPLPLCGEYQRLDRNTIILHNGIIDRWIIDISGITAIGVNR